MTIRFSCPHCDAAVAVRDEAAGKSGQCRQCGQRFTVPTERVGPSPLSPPIEQPVPKFRRVDERAELLDVPEAASVSLRDRRFHLTVSGKEIVPRADLEEVDRVVREHVANSDVFQQVDLRVTVIDYDQGSRLLRYLFPIIPGAAARVRITVTGKVNMSPVDRTIGVARYLGAFGGSSKQLVKECLRVGTGDVLLALDRAVGRSVSSFWKIWNTVQVGNAILGVIVLVAYAPAYYRYQSTIPHPFVRDRGSMAFAAIAAGLFAAFGVAGVSSSVMLFLAPSEFYLRDARGIRLMAILGAKSVVVARATALVLALIAAGLIVAAIMAYLDRS